MGQNREGIFIHLTSAYVSPGGRACVAWAQWVVGNGAVATVALSIDAFCSVGIS